MTDPRDSAMLELAKGMAGVKQTTEGFENLTPRQTAALLNVPEATLAVWRSTNRVVLPFFKLGHHVRYRRSDLERFIEQNTRNGKA